MADAYGVDPTPDAPLFDEFIRGVTAGTTTIAGVSGTGVGSSGGSSLGVISQSGRYVLFGSTSAGLVSSPTVDGLLNQVYLHDRGA